MLRDVLQLPEFVGLTDQQALDYLHEITVLKTDNTRYSYQGIVVKFGDQGEAIAATVLLLLASAQSDLTLTPTERALLDAEALSFKVGSADGRTGGLDFSQAARQAKLATWIDTLVADNQMEAAAALQAVKELGVTNGPRWQTPAYSIANDPILQDIIDARATIATDALRQKVTRRYNEVVALMDNGTATDWAAIYSAWEIEP